MPKSKIVPQLFVFRVEMVVRVISGEQAGLEATISDRQQAAFPPYSPVYQVNGVWYLAQELTLLEEQPVSVYAQADAEADYQEHQQKNRIIKNTKAFRLHVEKRVDCFLQEVHAYQLTREQIAASYDHQYVATYTSLWRLPELAVGDKVPADFTRLRGASSMAYEEGISLLYRRHYWYVTKMDFSARDEIVQHVCTVYREARDKYCAMVEEQIAAGIGKVCNRPPTIAEQDTTHYIM